MLNRFAMTRYEFRSVPPSSSWPYLDWHLRAGCRVDGIVSGLEAGIVMSPVLEVPILEGSEVSDEQPGDDVGAWRGEDIEDHDESVPGAIV